MAHGSAPAPKETFDKVGKDEEDDSWSSWSALSSEKAPGKKKANTSPRKELLEPLSRVAVPAVLSRAQSAPHMRKTGSTSRQVTAQLKTQQTIRAEALRSLKPLGSQGQLASRLGARSRNRVKLRQPDNGSSKPTLNRTRSGSLLDAELAAVHKLRETYASSQGRRKGSTARETLQLGDVNAQERQARRGSAIVPNSLAVKDEQPVRRRKKNRQSRRGVSKLRTVTSVERLDRMINEVAGEQRRSNKRKKRGKKPKKHRRSMAERRKSNIARRKTNMSQQHQPPATPHPNSPRQSSRPRLPSLDEEEEEDGELVD